MSGIRFYSNYVTPPGDLSKWDRVGVDLFPKDFATVQTVIGDNDPQGKILRVAGEFLADRNRVKLMNDEQADLGSDFAGAASNNAEENVLNGVLDVGFDVIPVMYVKTLTQLHLIRISQSGELIELSSGSADDSDRTRIEQSQEVLKLLREIGGNAVTSWQIDDDGAGGGVIVGTAVKGTSNTVVSIDGEITFIDTSDGVNNTVRIATDIVGGTVGLTRINGTSQNSVVVSNTAVQLDATNSATTTTGKVLVENNGVITISRNDGTDEMSISIDAANNIELSVNGSPVVTVDVNGRILLVLPAFADDAAAAVGGLTTGMAYQTDGTAILLPVAGVQMIKQ